MQGAEGCASSPHLDYQVVANPGISNYKITLKLTHTISLFATPYFYLFFKKPLVSLSETHPKSYFEIIVPTRKNLFSVKEKYTLLVLNAKKLFKKTFLWKPNLLKKTEILGTNQGVFWKEKIKGFLNIN